jgi:TusA-related sulfurtransferase
MIFNYDGTNDKCPVPLVTMRLLLKKMGLGDQCIVLIKDSGSVKDIPKLLTKKGYCYNECKLSDGVVKIVIESRY